jgi:hypothetical protein
MFVDHFINFLPQQPFKKLVALRAAAFDQSHESASECIYLCVVPRRDDGGGGGSRVAGIPQLSELLFTVRSVAGGKSAASTQRSARVPAARSRRRETCSVRMHNHCADPIYRVFDTIHSNRMIYVVAICSVDTTRRQRASTKRLIVSPEAGEM